jgi:drug/metabolite transporter (DMT)-like permease
LHQLATEAVSSRAAADQRRVTLAIVLAICSFGSAFPAVKLALRSFEPGPLALLRFAAASIALALYLSVTGIPGGVMREWPRLTFLAVANVAAYHLLFNSGQRLVSASAASVLINTSPIWSAVFAVLILKERPQRRLWLGLLVSFVGAGVIAISERGAFQLSAGALLVLSAALLQGLSFVVQRPAVREFGAATVTAISIWIGTGILAVLFGPQMIRQLEHASGASIAAVAYTGLVSSVFGLVCWAYVISELPASTASPFLMGVPLVATAVSLVLIGDWPKPTTILGGSLTLGGVVLGLGYFRRRPASR